MICIKVYETKNLIKNIKYNVKIGISWKQNNDLKNITVSIIIESETISHGIIIIIFGYDTFFCINIYFELKKQLFRQLILFPNNI